MSTIRYTRPVFKHAFRDNFSLGFPRKNCNVPCLDVIMIAIFPRNILRSSLFARKAHVNTERVPPGHPIILLKFNKFNMAAVSVRLSDYRIIRITIFVNFRPSERTCYSKCEIGNQRTGLPVWGKKRIVLLFKTLFSGNKRNRQKIFFLPHDFGLIK